MPIQSVGYERAIAYDDLGEIFSHAGAAYSVIGKDSFEVTPGPAPMQVKVRAGRATGQAILDTLPGDEILPAAPGTRWDTVAIRRDWAAKTSTLVILAGTAAEGIVRDPDAMTPGVLDDHPVALVRWAAGLTVPQQIIDLRIWASTGGAFGADPRVRDFANALGTRIRVGNSLWERTIVSGNPTWVDFAAATNLFIRRNNANVSIQDGLTKALDAIEGAGSSPAANRFAMWNPDGYMAMKDPQSPNHAANVRYVDSSFDVLMKPRKGVMRDAVGRIFIEDPVLDDQGATLGTVKKAIRDYRVGDNQLTPALRDKIQEAKDGKFAEGVYDRGMGTNTRAAYIRDDGALGYRTSSRRFKTDIETFTPDAEALRQIRAVVYRRIDEGDGIEHGVIAEELHDLGHHWLVIYDDDGQPLSVAYELIGLAALTLAQQQADRLDDLEERLRALEEGKAS